MDRISKCRLLVMGALISFSSLFQMGYANAYPNTAVDSFRVFIMDAFEQRGIHLSTSGFAWIWSAVLNVWFIGFAVGSWIAVPFSDRLGRTKTLLLGNVGNLLSSCMSTLGIIFHNIILFSIGRLAFSLSAAVSMNSLILLLQECSPSEIRGLMSFYAEMAFVVTNMVGALAGMRVVLGYNLPWLLGVSCIVSLLSVIVVIPFHESPKYLFVTKKDKEAAHKSLVFYQRAGDDEIARILNEYTGEMVAEKGTYRQLFGTRHLRKGVLLGISALQVASSVWPVVFFSTEFLKDAHVEAYTAEAVSTFMLFVSSISTVIGMIVVERFPRKKLLLCSGTLNMLALVLFAAFSEMQKSLGYGNIGCIVAVVLHGTTYSLALGPIAWFITAELLPLEHRASAQSLALSVNQLCALLFCTVTLPLFHKIGALTLIVLFVIPGSCALLILYFHLPETRNRKIDQVMADLKGENLDVNFDSIDLRTGSENN